MLPKNDDEATASSSSSKNNIPPSKSTSKSEKKDFEKLLDKLEVINWDDYIKTIDWGIEDEEHNIVPDNNIPSTSKNTSSLLNLNKSVPTQNGSATKRVEIVADEIQPCSSKTPIYANNSSYSNGIRSNTKKIPTTEVPSTSGSSSSTNSSKSSVLKIGLDNRRHLPPQIRHKHPYVAYKRFRDALSGTLGKEFRPPGIDTSIYEIIQARVSHLLPSEEDLKDPNSLPFKKYRQAMSQEFSKAIKTGELQRDDPMQYELINHEKHTNEIILAQVEDKHKFESEKIKERDKITRRMIEERYEEETEKVEKQYEAAVAQLAEKMIAENEEERRQLEAELAVIGEDGEVPANFNYLPNRKQLRRRTGNLNESTEHPDKIDPYVPIYQVHWIDPKDINSDLNIVNSVLQSSSDEGPFEKHISFQVQEGKLIIDGKTFNRGLNQIMIIRSQTYGEFPAIMLSLCDNCITVRSIIKGDPRHLTITRSDLENGRVRISKRTT